MHNPLRSERDVFRAVVVIGIGAGAVIALTLLTRPAFGAVLLPPWSAWGSGLCGEGRGARCLARPRWRGMPTTPIACS